MSAISHDTAFFSTDLILSRHQRTQLHKHYRSYLLLGSQINYILLVKIAKLVILILLKTVTIHDCIEYY